MPKFKQAVIKEFMEIIEESYFTSYSFKLEDSNEPNICIQILFKDDNKYYFSIANQEGLYFITQSPGKFMEVEQYTTDHFNSCFDYLKIWLNFLEEELRSIHPLVRDVEELRR